MQKLDAFHLPLEQSSLIEASAGTGKTYTIVSLYLRLLLGVNCRKPLTVQEILLVTFTKAATEEMRDRIRTRIATVRELFEQYRQNGKCEELERDAFLFALYQAVESELENALLRLKIAEQDIDLSSVFTIHSFCQKMLFQYAFDSGIQFDVELVPDEQKLRTQLSEAVWRELFYPMSANVAKFASTYLKNPAKALTLTKSFLEGSLPATQQAVSLPEDLAKRIDDYEQMVSEFKQFWLTHRDEIYQIIVEQSGWRADFREGRFRDLDAWVSGRENKLPEDKFEFFKNSHLQKSKKPISHPYFVKIEEYLTAYKNPPTAALKYLYLARLRQKLEHYKENHKQKSFSDLLRLLNRALQGQQGDVLVQQIRNQYPFAMIDEFQDTDQEQYQIFSRIFMSPNSENNGFIMIGDPKQSIYKFRGADIFTYLEAAGAVKERYTLNKNWRSLGELVTNTNKIFQFPSTAENSPFIEKKIAFSPVEFDQKAVRLAENFADLTFYLPEASATAEWSEKWVAKQTAYAIQQSLKAAEQGKPFLYQENQPIYLEAKDIAILVRSGNQAKLMKQALKACNIASVYLSERSSVFASQEAVDLSHILKACLQPQKTSLLLSAIGSSLWGLTASKIFDLKQKEGEWDKLAEQFEQYRLIWQHQGILPMLHKLFLKERIIERLYAAENAERRLTDVLHLAELLQAKMDIFENENALLQWFEQQIAEPNENSDEQKLRLESEEDLVKIVTIHASKGLEYPVVWLPFVAFNNDHKKDRELTTYRDENGTLCWQSKGDVANDAVNKEMYAEELRLLYVALTRAKYQMHLVLPDSFKNKEKSDWNALLYLLSNGEIGLGETAQNVMNSEDYITKKGFEPEHITWWQSGVLADDWKPKKHHHSELQAKNFTGHIAQHWSVTSFSHLKSVHDRLQQRQQQSQERVLLQDYDLQQPQEIVIENDARELYSAFTFPHSIKVGNLLHRFFEKWNFNQTITAESVVPLCEQLELDENWREPTAKWLETVRVSPMIDGFSLADIRPNKRLDEWQFYLNLANPKALPKLNKLLQQHSPLAEKLPELQLPQLEGFVRGFVDMVAEHQGRYYLIDYKSNFLGYLPQDYSTERIEKTMLNYRYDLQYLLYTLALHRYLKFRLAENYDYERDFGGVAYLFLRGMNGNAQSGVYFDKPTLALIDELDKLFD